MNKKKLYREIKSFEPTHLNEKYKKLSFTIVLVQPETYGNIGSIARVMKNFNFQHLVIFNPIEDVEKIKSHDAQGFAMHGKDILLNAEIIEIEKQEEHINKLKRFLDGYDLVIGTTAKGKRYTNIRRLAIFPYDFNLPITEKPFKIAILFGKESRGLTNEEIAMSDILLRIPTNDEYPTLNLSHAAAIILYEFFKKLYVIRYGRGENPILIADKEDRQYLYKTIDSLIEILKIRDYKKENMFFAFKNIFERSLMSKKELSLIIGLFSKIESILKNLNLYE
ncbi:MAG: RNA methyltransferase [Promethearchaeia archaeon]